MKSDLREDQGSLPEESSLKHQKQNETREVCTRFLGLIFKWVVEGGDTFESKMTAATTAQIDFDEKQERFSFGRFGQSFWPNSCCWAQLAPFRDASKINVSKVDVKF